MSNSLSIVECSDEDQCFIGCCPGIIGRCCHGDDKVEVCRRLFPIVAEWLEIDSLENRTLPSPRLRQIKESLLAFWLTEENVAFRGRFNAAVPLIAMTLNEFIGKLIGLNVWKQGGKRAPHKPLLLLLAVGKAVRGEERLAPFSEIEKTLSGLLRHFGPPSKAFHPEFPFGRLVTDGLWEIPGADSLRRTRSGDLHTTELRTRGITGWLAGAGLPVDGRRSPGSARRGPVDTR